MSAAATTTAAHATDDKIAARYPGMRAVAGPYAVNSTTDGIAQAEKASCYRTLRDQLANDPAAKIIMVGRFAWVIRSAAGWIEGQPRKKYDEKLGIKAGRLGKP